jgi:hypothetical protein
MPDFRVLVSGCWAVANTDDFEHGEAPRVLFACSQYSDLAFRATARPTAGMGKREEQGSKRREPPPARLQLPAYNRP